MKRLLYLFLIAALAALLVRKYLVEVIYIASASMEPTYLVDEQLVIGKFLYFLSDPERGDVIMLSSPSGEKDIIKRVVGLPGESVSIQNKHIYIDGNELEEDYTQFLRPHTILVGDNIESFTVPDEHYFVMGDNRDVSRDSRDWSEDPGLQTYAVPRRSIKGKVLFRLN